MLYGHSFRGGEMPADATAILDRIGVATDAIEGHAKFQGSAWKPAKEDPPGLQGYSPNGDTLLWEGVYLPGISEEDVVLRSVDCNVYRAPHEGRPDSPTDGAYSYYVHMSGPFLPLAEHIRWYWHDRMEQSQMVRSAAISYKGLETFLNLIRVPQFQVPGMSAPAVQQDRRLVLVSSQK